MPPLGARRICCQPRGRACSPRAGATTRARPLKTVVYVGISARPVDNRHRAVWAPLAAGGLYLALLAVAIGLSRATGAPGPICPFKLLTGLPCPTCGSTRMVMALVTGHFADAWRLNPLVMSLVVLAALWLAVRRTGLGLMRGLSPSMRRAGLVMLALAAAVNWAYLIAAGR